jgi:glycine C-acetyltransferase
MSKPLLRFLSVETRHLEQAGLSYPEPVLTTPQGPSISIGGPPIANFASNDYLGLCSYPAVKKAAVAAAESFGVGVAASRIAAGTLPLHTDLERALCELTGADAAMVFASGYHANTGVFESLVGERDYVFCDEQIRPSLADGIRLCRARVYSYRNGDLAHLEDRLKRSRAARFRIVVTDGVYPLSGGLAPLREIYELGEKYEALVVVDDSHGLGVLGQAGGGTHQQLGIGTVDVVTGSFGTTLGGGAGGFVAGKKEVIQWLRQKSRPYLASTALAPPAAAAALKSVEIVRSESLRRETLAGKVAVFRKALAERGLRVMPGDHPAVSVLIRDAVAAQRLTDLLHRKNIFAVGFCHPVVPEDTARIRFQVTLLHEENVLRQTADAVAECLKQVEAMSRRKAAP